MEGERWKVEGERWKVKGGRWKVEGEKWKVEGGRLYTLHFTLYTATRLYTLHGPKDPLYFTRSEGPFALSTVQRTFCTFHGPKDLLHFPRSEGPFALSTVRRTLTLSTVRRPLYTLHGPKDLYTFHGPKDLKPSGPLILRVIHIRIEAGDTTITLRMNITQTFPNATDEIRQDKTMFFHQIAHRCKQ